MKHILIALLLFATLAAGLPTTVAAKPLQVFILAGQSNMQGHAKVSTVEHTGMDPATQPPGPKAGPFQAHPGDGSVVTYYWYRFADQPAMLNADMTDQEREAVHAKMEKIHKSWKKDREYLPPPTTGELAEIDPALIVTPPAGLEAGYVPIVTRQAAKE